MGVLDTTHATDALGWTPKWSTGEMFAQSYDWFVANRAATDMLLPSHTNRATRPLGAEHERNDHQPRPIV